MRKYLLVVLLATSVAMMVLSRYDKESRTDTASGSGGVDSFSDPIVIEFPLRGEWMAPNTPGSKIPSHGTDQLGERYALDLLQVDWGRKGNPFYNAHPLQYLFLGIPLNKCYCWGEKVYAPCDGEIVAADDGCAERQRVHPVSDLFIAFRNAHRANPFEDGVQSLAGNYVIMKCRNNVYAAFAHLQMGSVAVSIGQRIRRGEFIGRVGHSGNSTAPHLHFQLMDSSDILTAKGIPCVFESYEIYQAGKWKTIYNSVPTNKDRIRYRKGAV